jgi:hypothetical protein
MTTDCNFNEVGTVLVGRSQNNLYQMKKVFMLCAALSLATTNLVLAQEVKKASNAVKTEATKVGNKTAEVATKAESKVADDKVPDKVGPNGQTIYYKKKTNQYYWVDDKGHKKFIKKTALMSK